MLPQLALLEVTALLVMLKPCVQLATTARLGKIQFQRSALKDTHVLTRRQIQLSALLETTAAVEFQQCALPTSTALKVSQDIYLALLELKMH